MAETLESIKQEIAKIAAEKADLKGIVDRQKDTIKRQETTIGNLQEELKAADANMVDRVSKLQKEIDELKARLTDWKRIAEERKEKSIQIHNARVSEEKRVIELQKEIDEFKEALDREATENAELQQKVRDYEEYKEDVRKLTELKEELKKNLEASKSAHNRTWEEKKNLEIEVHELSQQVAALESVDNDYLKNEVDRLSKLLDTAYAGIANRDKEIDVLNGDIEELKANGSPGTIAALAAKDEELRKLGEKVPAKDREINDLKEQVKSLEEALDLKGDYYYRAQTEKEHLANAIENAYRSLMITRGYQLPGESGESNG